MMTSVGRGSPCHGAIVSAGYKDNVPLRVSNVCLPTLSAVREHGCLPALPAGYPNNLENAASILSAPLPAKRAMYLPKRTTLPPFCPA